MKDLPFASTKQKRSKRTEGMGISKCLQGKLVLLHGVGFYPSANQYDAFEKKNSNDNTISPGYSFWGNH